MENIQFLFIYILLLGSFFFYHVSKEGDEQKIDKAVFGFAYIDTSEFPECQTDMSMSTAWTGDLMYLNGVWTAACVAEARRQLKGE